MRRAANSLYSPVDLVESTPAEHDNNDSPNSSKKRRKNQKTLPINFTRPQASLTSAQELPSEKCPQDALVSIPKINGRDDDFSSSNDSDEESRLEKQVITSLQLSNFKASSKKELRNTSKEWAVRLGHQDVRGQNTVMIGELIG